LFYNNSDTLFVLDGLEPGNIYDIELIAINKKGKSATTFLHGHTLKGPEKQTGALPNLQTKLIWNCY